MRKATISSGLFILCGLAILLSACSAEHISDAAAGGAKALSGREVRALLTGSTVKSQGYGETAEIRYLPGGKLSGKNIDNDRDTGRWQIDKQGRLCLRFRHWGQGDKMCYQLYRQGDRYKQFNDSGILAYTFTMVHQGRSLRRDITHGNRDKRQPARVAAIPAPPASPEDLGFIIRQSARNCPGCNFAGAQLSGADLAHANLAGANLAGADLSYAVLHHANLRGANLYKANLKGADLSGADLTGANLTDTDLSKVTGLKRHTPEPEQYHPRNGK